MLSKTEIEAMVEDSLPDMKNRLKEELTTSMIYNIKEQFRSELHALSKKFFEEEIAPEIQKTLLDSKEGIIATIPVFAEESNKMILQALLDTLKKNLEQSWNRKEIIETLFKS